uniref:Uncharacterized protein n=1 Tax=Leersia perrieri TaxID=77586 RepID=A0A0D9XTQ9_9ORYZ
MQLRASPSVAGRRPGTRWGGVAVPWRAPAGVCDLVRRSLVPLVAGASHLRRRCLLQFSQVLARGIY